MQLATIHTADGEVPALVDDRRGVVRVDTVEPGFTGDVMALLDADTYARVSTLADSASDALFTPASAHTFAAPYRRPRKIWGIGLNYREHAGDLAAPVPTEPASFLKGDHTVVGPGEPILLPAQSQRVTAEAELGLVIGKHCRNVPEDEALDYVWGVCVVLDQTAEDILQRNPRFLTRAKNFPTFFSFGPTLVPLSDVLQRFSTLEEITVSTVRNGEPVRTNTVANMTFGPAMLVSFHSAVMPLFPGDILSTGTPGAVVIEDGDVAEARIPGIGTLVNPVRRRH